MKDKKACLRWLLIPFLLFAFLFLSFCAPDVKTPAGQSDLMTTGMNALENEIRPEPPEVNSAGLETFVPVAKRVSASKPTFKNASTAKANAAATPAQECPPCAITDEEIVMLAKVLYREAGALGWRGTQYGVSYKARQAAIAWCALDRVTDPNYPDTLKGVLTYPYAFAWIEDTPVTDELLWLAQDVTARWWREQCGETDVGRTLPNTYHFFGGDGKENYFRNAYQSPYNVWDWSLPDPYKEDAQ